MELIHLRESKQAGHRKQIQWHDLPREQIGCPSPPTCPVHHDQPQASSGHLWGSDFRDAARWRQLLRLDPDRERGEN